jgi:hypothetical protein
MMTPEKFVDGIKIAVRDSAIATTLKVLDTPIGRVPDAEDIEMSKWFHGLSVEQKKQLPKILKLAVDSCVFGFLNVIDGSRVIEEGSSKGDFELYYVNGDTGVLINQDMLHDIFNAPE